MSQRRGGLSHAARQVRIADCSTRWILKFIAAAGETLITACRDVYCHLHGASTVISPVFLLGFSCAFRVVQEWIGPS